MQLTFLSTHETDTQALAAHIAYYADKYCDNQGFLITLSGDLGAGKTTFSQGFIRALLPNARVKSPTFSLIESYPLADKEIHHLDLYRLQDPEELEYLGLRDLFWHNICLIEWASRGEGWLPSADLAIELLTETEGRQLQLMAVSPKGTAVLTALHTMNEQGALAQSGLSMV